MDAIELSNLTADLDAQTTSIPVPRSLMAAITEDPQQFGLPAGLSRRQALSRLLIKGARSAAFHEQEASLEASYRRLQSDPEWQGAAAEARAESLDDGLY